MYVFTLDYKPAALQSTPIVRSSGVTVSVECHYPRSSVFFFALLVSYLAFRSFGCDE